MGILGRIGVAFDSNHPERAGDSVTRLGCADRPEGFRNPMRNLPHRRLVLTVALPAARDFRRRDGKAHAEKH